MLVANTYHELARPGPILSALRASMRSGARLVIVDRAPLDRGEPHGTTAEHNEIGAALAADEIRVQGFELVTRDDRFIDRPADDEVWWVAVFRKP